MRSHLKTLGEVMKQNVELCEKEKGNLDSLQEKYIEAVNSTFTKRRSESDEKLRTCNVKLKTHYEELEQKITALEERVNTHQDSQALYSNHDAIEMEQELKDLVGKCIPDGFELKSSVFVAEVNFDTDMESIQARIQNLVLHSKGKWNALLASRSWMQNPSALGHELAYSLSGA